MKRRELQVKWVVRDVVEPINGVEYGGLMRGSQDTVPYLAPWAGELQEVFIVLLLNAHMKVIGHKEVGRGTATTCPTDVSAIFRAAVVGNASSIIVAHNHPSGDVTPSVADITVTANIKKAGEILEIPLLDHIVFGLAPDGKVISRSLREQGLM